MVIKTELKCIKDSPNNGIKSEHRKNALLSTDQLFDTNHDAYPNCYSLFTQFNLPIKIEIRTMIDALTGETVIVKLMFKLFDRLDSDRVRLASHVSVKKQEHLFV